MREKIKFIPTYQPSISWERLIKKLIPDKYKIEKTYSRASTRKIGTFIGLNKSLGINSMAVGPGKKTVKNLTPFCIMWDKSFDLYSIKQKLLKIINENASKLNYYFVFIRIFDDIKSFKVDLKLNKIIPFSLNKFQDKELYFDFDELFNIENKFENIDNISLKETSDFLIKYKPNIILFTNSEFSKITKELIAYRIVGRRRIGFIASNKDEYVKLIKKIGELKNLTYIN
jgi:hypothetical protein